MKYRLFDGIVAHSVSKVWEQARDEWENISSEWGDEETCLCGHNPIKEHCYLRNKITKETVVVGNQCVHLFPAIPAQHRLFANMRRLNRKIAGNPVGLRSGLNKDVINYAIQRNWLTPDQRDFVENTCRKHWKTLSETQRNQRIEINELLLNKFMSQDGNNIVVDILMPGVYS